MTGVPLFLSKGDYQVLVADLLATLAGSGLPVVLHLDENDTTDTIAGASTTEKSYSLPANTYAEIIVEAEIEIIFAGSSTNQTVQIEIWDGVSVIKTFNMRTLNALGIANLEAKTSFNETSAQTISIKQHGLSGADGNTNITVHSLRVYGVL